MSEINTKIFKPQKWVLDVLNSPKGETIEFEIEGATYSFIKISDKVPEDMGKRVYFYLYVEEYVSLSDGIFTEIDPSIYVTNGLLIFTDDIEGISKGIYLPEELDEEWKEGGATEVYLILQTNQDFSISKKTIEGEVHPIEEKYIPGGGGGSAIHVIDCEYLGAYTSGYIMLPYTVQEFEQLVENLIENGCVMIALRVINTDLSSMKQVYTSLRISKDPFACSFIGTNLSITNLSVWYKSDETSTYNDRIYLEIYTYD